MKFIKEDGNISYGAVGSFLDKLPKDQWLDINKKLQEIKSENTATQLLPALDFFKKVGHIDLQEEKRVKVLKDRTVTTPEEVRKEVRKAVSVH